MVQVLVRCGAPHGSVALDVACGDTVETLLQRLAVREPELGHAADMRLLWSGRQLQDSDAVPCGDDAPCSSSASAPYTLHLSYRLLGGGGDGGSTGAESRSCYLEMYAGKKCEKTNPAEELYAKWTRCHLSGETLAPPVVVDELGNLFNKDAIVSALLHKTVPPPLAYISSLKHLMELKLERTGSRVEAAGTSAAGAGVKSATPGNEAQFCCPVTGVACNGRYKFVAIRPSGITVSEKALKEAPLVVQELVGGPWGPDDVVPINPTGEVLDALREKALARVAADREKKRGKKAAKGGAAAVGGVASASAGNGSGNGGAAEGPVGNGAVETAASVANGKRSMPAPAAAAAGAAAAAAPAAAAAAADGLPAAKRAKPVALETMPKNSTKEVYASLFSSSVVNPQKETYCCRSTSARGVHLT